MAKIYFERVSELIKELNIENETTAQIEIRHFFSGAAIYANSIICASWSPEGLAFKLPERETTRLIETGKAKPLKYFEKGNIKKGYALFEDPEKLKNSKRKNYLLKSIEHCG
jgi:TfoX/Sxy family transcriptional regulator of competence genes